MSEAPEQIGLVEGLPGRWRLWTREDDGSHQDHAVRYVRADRLEAQEALLREAAEALEEIAVRDSLPTPSFGGVKLGQYAYINRAGPLAEIAHAALAKLRAHFGETE